MLVKIVYDVFVNNNFLYLDSLKKQNKQKQYRVRINQILVTNDAGRCI